MCCFTSVLCRFQYTEWHCKCHSFYVPFLISYAVLAKHVIITTNNVIKSASFRYTCTLYVLQEAQLMPTNPRDAFRGQSRSRNVVPFHMLGIVPSCSIVTVFTTRRFSDIRLQNAVTLKTGLGVRQGH